MSGVSAWRCKRCTLRAFPKRELCPHCGGRKFAQELVARGIATEVTSHRGVRIARVRIDGDLTLLARAEGSVAPGSEVTLRHDDGAPVATGA